MSLENQRFDRGVDLRARAASRLEGQKGGGRGGSAPIKIDRTILVGRAEGVVDVVLPDPTVSRRHAKLYRRGDTVMVVDLRSTYGTFVGGKRIPHEARLEKGQRLAIGKYQFVFDGSALVPDSTPSSELSLACVGVSRIVRDRGTGRPLQLLHGITLAVRPKELVCLIGPSGSGKSTLLSVLSGRVVPEQGQVVYGGRDLHQEFDSLKHDLAIVPQKEALHQLLTVRQSLWYAAGLRLPSDTTSGELDRIVAERIVEVGLAGRENVRIRDLSGGQLKRISLANEIAHRPNLVFLDEVTSGLDELGDEDMMKLFRQLADKGRSVVCITHNTLNIERSAHVVVVLTAGGRLACVGAPQEVCRYFGLARLGDVYNALAQRSPEDWEARFLRHPLKEHYIDKRLPPRPSGQATNAVHAFQSVSARRPIRLGRQLALLAGRVFALQVMDFKTLAMGLGQAVFVGGMLVALYGDVQDADETFTQIANSRNAAFLLLVSVFWLGCNNAAPEIVKERVLFDREQAVSVNAATYYLAKLVVLGGVSFLQAMVVYSLLFAFCNLPGSDEFGSVARQVLTISMVGLLATFMGLAISAQSKTEEMAVRAVPLVLIPQIVLANVIASLDGWLDWVARLAVSTYWSFQAFTSGVDGYCQPGEDSPAFFPAILMLSVHYLVLVAIATLGLSPRAGAGKAG